jgi:hypothetical protein
VARISWPYLQWACAFVLYRTDAWLSTNLRGNVIIPFLKSVLLSSNHDPDFSSFALRTQCLPL